MIACSIWTLVLGGLVLGLAGVVVFLVLILERAFRW